MMDFTLEKYEQLIKTIKEKNIAVYGIKMWQQLKPASGILLRHDVDRKALNALRVAELEFKFGVASTYYFRVTKGSFDESVIKTIYQLGHEIGYHYEDLSIAGGDYDRAYELFQKHLGRLRQLVPVETVAMHGRPFSAYDNRDLLRKYDFKKLGILAEAYLDVDYSDMYYFTDTGRTWGQTRANIRDNVEGSLFADISSTDSLIFFAADNASKKIAVVMHPERWSNTLSAWAIQYFADTAANIIKGFVR